jgi:hypothetical protein
MGGRRRCTTRSVEERALLRGCEQRLMCMLPVQVDQGAPRLRELGDRREPAVDVAAAASDDGHDAREHHFFVLRRGDEATFDARFRCAFAHRTRVGSTSAQQFQRVDEQRLARTGLAGDRGHPRTQRDQDLLDDAEVLDAQLDEHQRSGSANFALRIW